MQEFHIFWTLISLSNPIDVSQKASNITQGKKARGKDTMLLYVGISLGHHGYNFLNMNMNLAKSRQSHKTFCVDDSVFSL